MTHQRFWGWFFRGSEKSKSGLIDLLWSISTMFCVLTAAMLSYVARHMEFYELARAAIFPLTGIFIGVSFTGASFALSKLQSDSIRELISRDKGEIEYFVFGFQSAVLLLLISVVYCALGVMGIFSSAPCAWQYSLTFALFFLLGMSVVQCWKVVNFCVSLAHLQFLVWWRERKKGRGLQPPQPTKPRP